MRIRCRERSAACAESQGQVHNPDSNFVILADKGKAREAREDR